jgi:hypothetical protein
MSVVFFEGFDYYSSKNEVSGKWGGGNLSSTASNLITPGRGGEGKGFRLGSSTNALSRSFTGIKHATLGLGVLFEAQGSTLTAEVLRFGPVILRNLATTGEVTLQTTDTGSSTLATLPGVFSSESWIYLEVEVNLNSDGWIRIYRNGDMVLDYTSLTSGLEAMSVSTLELKSGGLNSIRGFDDVYIMDADGHSTGHLGPVKARYVPVGADISTDWTPDEGADNFARVNELVADGDSSYVESDTVGDEDHYSMEEQNFPPGLDVHAVQINTIGRTLEAGVANVTPKLRLATAEEDGSVLQFSETGYRVRASLFTTLPDSSDPITSNVLDDFEIKLEMT